MSRAPAPLAPRRRTRQQSHVPVTVDRDLSRRWLRARATGSLSIDEVTEFLRTARAPVEMRMWPLLFDARGCRTSMALGDIDKAVGIVRKVAEQQQQRRAHVALVADDDVLYRWFLDYETRCAALGVRVIRVFRQFEDAERWLDIVSAARELG
jgi:hypothetical protein